MVDRLTFLKIPPSDTESDDDNVFLNLARGEVDRGDVDEDGLTG